MKRKFLLIALLAVSLAPTKVCAVDNNIELVQPMAYYEKDVIVTVRVNAGDPMPPLTREYNSGGYKGTLKRQNRPNYYEQGGQVAVYIYRGTVGKCDGGGACPISYY